MEDLIYPGIAVIVGLVIIIILLSALIVGRNSGFSRKNDALFGSTVKVAQGPGPFPQVPVKVQPESRESSIEPFNGCDIEKVGDHRRSTSGLSSESSHWSRFEGQTVEAKEGPSTSSTWKLWFKVQYFPDNQSLEVTVFRAKCFPEKYQSDSSTFAFVSLYLLPEESVRHTGLYCNTGSPSLDESFTFQLSASEVNKKMLRLSLYDMDTSRTRICLGNAIVKLSELDDLEHGGTHYLTKDMQDITQISEPMPEVHVSLCYQIDKEKLKLQIFAARNLPDNLPAGYRYYLRINIIVGTKSAKVKRTDLSSSLFGVFQFSYAFQVPARHLDACCIQFSVMQVNPKSGQELLYGSFVIGPCMYAHGVGMDHWKQMLANTRKTVEMWHKLVLEP